MIRGQGEDRGYLMEHLNGCLNGFDRISGSQWYDIVMEFANKYNFVLSFVVRQQIYLSIL